MATTQRVIHKSLAGAEDLLNGVGVVQQSRGGQSYGIHKLDVPVPVSSVEEMQTLDVEFARVYDNDLEYTDYRQVSAGIWIRTASAEKRDALARQAADAGYNLVAGSFEEGGSLVNAKDVLWYIAGNTYLNWFDGTAKTVSAGSTPMTTGGISAGAWVDRTDETLRGELSSDSGAQLQAYKRGSVAWSVRRTLQEVLDETHVDLTGVLPANIQAALDYCYTLSEYTVVKLPKSLMMTSGLIVRIDKVQLIGPSVLDFTGMPSGTAPDYNYALTLTASTNPPYRQVHDALVDIELVGPNKSVQTCGVRYNSEAENSGVSHIALHNVNIHGFAEGEMYQNHAYIITHYNCDLWGNSRAILQDSGYTDYGERIGYIGCSIYNNDRVLDANHANGGIHFINCSVDYNTDFGEVRAGYVTLTDCHMEIGTYTSSYLNANGVGAAIDMNGGWLLCTGRCPHNSDSFAYAAEGASVRIRPTKANNMLNTANRWGKGGGVIDVDICNSYQITENPIITADSNNLLADGSFESTTVVDDVFITDDTAPITSRTSGTNINLSTSADAFKTGAKSLKATKTFGSGSPSSFAITAYIEKHSRVGIALNYKKIDAATGTMHISWAYAAGYKVDSNGVPRLSKIEGIGTKTVSLSGPTEWVNVTRGEPFGKSPAWATHIAILVNMDSIAAGSVYFDDVVITCG